MSAATIEVLLGARHKVGQALLKTVEAAEIDVTAIHQGEGTRFQPQVVECLDIGHFSRGNTEKTRNVAAQVDQRMQLDSSLASAKMSPREELETEIDRRGVESINGFLERHT